MAAKVYYQLQEYDESMVFALGSGKLFDIHHDGEFEETILGECPRGTTVHPRLLNKALLHLHRQYRLSL